METLTHTREDAVTATVRESFAPDLDGFWYPKQIGAALVRIRLQGTDYTIERRRKPHTAWMPVVIARRSEFDPESFRTWAKSWPLTALN